MKNGLRRRCLWEERKKKDADHSISLAFPLPQSLVLLFFPPPFIPLFLYFLAAPLHRRSSLNAASRSSLIALCLRGINEGSWRRECIQHPLHTPPLPTSTTPLLYPQCFVPVGDVHQTVSNELTCVPHYHCFFSPLLLLLLFTVN